MQRALRRAARVVAIGMLALSATGCLRAYQDLTLNPDNTVDGTIVFAVDRQLLELTGQSVDDLQEQIEGEAGIPEGVDVESAPYEDGDFVGREFTFTGAPLSVFDGTSGADELSIVRQGDTFVVSGTFDATGEEFDTSQVPGGEGLLDSLDVHVSVTFPGEVRSHNGELEGTTVTWRLGFGEVNELEAVGSAIGTGGGGTSALVWILLAVAVVVGIPGGVVATPTRPLPRTTRRAPRPHPPPPRPRPRHRPSPRHRPPRPPSRSRAPHRPPCRRPNRSLRPRASRRPRRPWTPRRRSAARADLLGRDVPDRVIVVGGGLVGLCTAWFLRAAGASVTVLEAERPGSGASRGNAGAICPSLVDPLPAPGTIRRAFLSMPRSDAALHVRPTYAPRMAGFLRRFAAAATRERYEAGYAALAGLAAGAGGAWDVLAAGGVRGDARREGYLIVHAERSDAERSLAHVCRAASLGLCREPGELLDHDGLVQREPLLGAGARAGFVIPDERWVDPSVLVDELAAALVRSGVELVEGSPVDDVRDGPDDVVVHGGGSMRRADAVVVAAGVWSAGLLRRLVRLPLLPGKGYSFSLRPASLPVRVVHLEDAHVMLTPMGDRLRVAGTMEFDGTTGRFNPRRIDAIVRAVRPFLDRDVELDRRGEEWVGPRPITPDGLPYLGAVAGHPRVFVAAGHNMLGLTLAAVSGRAIAGLVGGGERRPELDPFDPGRFGG